MVPIPSGFFGGTVNPKEDFEAAGGEFVIGWQRYKKFKSSLSYSYGQLIGAKPANERFPEYMIKFSIESDFLNNQIQTRLDFNTVSGYDTSPETERHSVYANSRTLLNMNVAWEVNPGIRLSFAGRNITGESTPSIEFDGNPTSSALGEDERFYYLGVSFNLSCNKKGPLSLNEGIDFCCIFYS